MIGCTSRRRRWTHSVASQALSFTLACCLPSPHFIFIHSHPPPAFFWYSFLYISIFPLCRSTLVLFPLSSPPLLSIPVPTFPPRPPSAPVCQKSASITGCCWITVAIMQIYLLFSISKKKEKASFVRVRTNLHWAMCTRDERHLSRYIYIVFLLLHLHKCGIFWNQISLPAITLYANIFN